MSTALSVESIVFLATACVPTYGAAEQAPTEESLAIAIETLCEIAGEERPEISNETYLTRVHDASHELAEALEDSQPRIAIRVLQRMASLESSLEAGVGDVADRALKLRAVLVAGLAARSVLSSDEDRCD